MKECGSWLVMFGGFWVVYLPAPPPPAPRPPYHTYYRLQLTHLPVLRSFSFVLV